MKQHPLGASLGNNSISVCAKLHTRSTWVVAFEVLIEVAIKEAPFGLQEIPLWALHRFFKVTRFQGAASLRLWRGLGYNRLFACSEKGLAETRCTRSSCQTPFQEKLNLLRR